MMLHVLGEQSSMNVPEIIKRLRKFIFETLADRCKTPETKREPSPLQTEKLFVLLPRWYHGFGDDIHGQCVTLTQWLSRGQEFDEHHPMLNASLNSREIKCTPCPHWHGGVNGQKTSG